MSNSPTKLNFFHTTWRRLKIFTVTIGTLGAGLTIVNLPFPGIRETIAQKAPVLLLPSVASWDYHYREGMVDFQQAEQLIQQAKHPNDLDQGDRKLKSAQSHLNALPLQGFEQYGDTYYCTFRSCGWNFSSREIQQRREESGRIEAILTQERNLQLQLKQITETIANTEAEFKITKDEAKKQIILAKWEQNLSQLDMLQSNSLMGRIARTEHDRVSANYQKITGLTQAQTKSGNLLQAAAPFAQAAQKLTAANSIHSVDEWQAIVRQWDAAIDQLQSIPVENPDYVKSRKVISDYQQQLDRAKIRLNQERTAAEDLKVIETRINTLVQNHTSLNRDQAKAELMTIEAKLKSIPKNVTSYDQAQDWLASLRKRLDA
jgi:hypothetical protein